MASIADPRAAVATPPPSLSPIAARRAWKRPENGPAPVVAPPPGNPIMDADSWPALPGQVSPAPPPKASSPKPAAAAPPTAPTVAVVSPVSMANSGAKAELISPLSLGNSGANPGDDDDELAVRSPLVWRALVMSAGDDGLVTPAGDDGLLMRAPAPELSRLLMCAPAPELSPVYSPNARSNGDHNQNGRFGSHPHRRNGGYGGGNRRGNGGRHGGHEHHGGFDGQGRGGGRGRDGNGPGHQQRGDHQPSYVRAPPPPPLAVVAAPPPPPPFVGSATPQTPPYGAPMGFPAEMAPHVYYIAVPTSDGIQALPFVPPPPPPTPPAMLISPLEQLQRDLLVQIDYYFSDENLCKDIYLRQHMDDQGWVPVSLVAGFNQVQMFLNHIGQVRTLNLQFILDTMLLSTVVEVQGDKIRRRARWEIWLLRRSNHSARSSSGSQSPVISNVDSLASQFQSVGLERTRYHPSMQGMAGEALLTRSATSDSIGYQSPTLGGLHSNGSGPIVGQQTARSLLRSNTF